MASICKVTTITYLRSGFISGKVHLKNCCCPYATKKKDTFSIIRWNAENMLLYGAKRKDIKIKAAVKGEAPAAASEQTSASESGHNTSKKKVAKTKKLVPKEATREIHKAKFSGPADDSFEEDSVCERLTDLQNTFDDNCKTGDVEERLMKLQTELDGSFTDIFESSPNSVSIPSILPIPGSESQPAKKRVGKSASFGQEQIPTEREKPAVDMVVPDKKESILTPTQTGTLNFVLQFPLFLGSSQLQQQRSTQADEFRATVEACKLRFFPTVNVVLNKTRSELGNFFLQRWREKMIKELGEAGFKKHQDAVIWQGTNFHACLQQYLSGVALGDIQIPERNIGHWNSISAVLAEVSDIQALETNVSHPYLKYKGTLDCVAKYKKTLCVFDWKTSDKAKPLLSNLYDNPLQVAAYLGAVNACADFTAKFGVVEHAAIVVAYTNGEAAHIHRMPPAICHHYWTQWCQRLHQYWTMVVAEKGPKETLLEVEEKWIQ